MILEESPLHELCQPAYRRQDLGVPVRESSRDSPSQTSLSWPRTA
ncbi:hypothetical protein RISK_000175 [Rhodopirellula islandica]|uniref:Uncharacterized protein n=1 Tax=Rhodopirellula islandica TaxID=595434 RepID=A0A0J1BMS8_RHOIS|nr:hypothetical protein RISK_000175 [Rhodopirellula islandica]